MRTDILENLPIKILADGAEPSQRLWRIFDETNKRPEAVIEEIY
jgi:hypothetical protein